MYNRFLSFYFGRFLFSKIFFFFLQILFQNFWRRLFLRISFLLGKLTTLFLLFFWKNLWYFPFVLFNNFFVILWKSIWRLDEKLVSFVENFAILSNKIQILLKLSKILIFWFLHFEFHGWQVHWIFDHIKISWDLKFDWVNWLFENFRWISFPNFFQKSKHKTTHRVLGFRRWNDWDLLHEAQRLLFLFFSFWFLLVLCFLLFFDRFFSLFAKRRAFWGSIFFRVMRMLFRSVLRLHSRTRWDFCFGLCENASFGEDMFQEGALLFGQFDQERGHQ